SSNHASHAVEPKSPQALLRSLHLEEASAYLPDVELDTSGGAAPVETPDPAVRDHVEPHRALRDSDEQTGMLSAARDRVEENARNARGDAVEKRLLQT